MPGPHDKIIADAARHALSPLRFRRKGRSRTWVADQSWWLAVVEFQPSAWSKGSYLNVGAHWLWSEPGYVSIDLGGRVLEFEEYVSNEQFAIAASDLAHRAAQEARRLTGTITSVSAAADALLSVMDALSDWDRSSWPAYHAGIAAGLDGRSAVAAEIFGRIDIGARSTDSILHPAAEHMARLVHDPAAFQQEAAILVTRQRRAVGLPALEAPPF